MTEILFENGASVSLGAISKEEDLKGSGCIPLNPPSDDRRCDVCGKHISELKPFGGPGDPLVGDFSGALLVGRYRRMAPYDEAAEKAWKEAWKEAEEVWKERGSELLSENPNQDYFLGWFIGKYGREKGINFYSWEEIYCAVSKSWECRDCTILDEYEHFEALKKRSEREKE